MLFKQKGRQKQKQNSNGSSEPTKTVEQSIQKNINPIYLQAIQVERKEETKTKIKEPQWANNNSQTINLEKIKTQLTCRSFKWKGRKNRSKNQLATVSQQQQSNTQPGKIYIQFTCRLFKQKGRKKQKQKSTGHSEPTKTVKQSIRKNKNPIYLQAIQVERKEKTKRKIEWLQ